MATAAVAQLGKRMGKDLNKLQGKDFDIGKIKLGQDMEEVRKKIEAQAKLKIEEQ